MEIRYEKTDNPDEFTEIRTTAMTVRKSWVKAEIAKLETHLANTSQPKINPDQMTLDHWNNTMVDNTRSIEKSLSELKSMLTKLEKVEISGSNPLGT